MHRQGAYSQTEYFQGMLMTVSLHLPQHMLIKHAVSALGRREETSLALWNTMATALGNVIGDAGFESLFFRSIYKFEARYPWMAACDRNEVSSITYLTACMATQPFDEAEEASIALLIEFTDTLNVLIGELITNRILRAAWEWAVENNVAEQSNE